MPFMEKQFEFGTFLRVERKHGETDLVPVEFRDDSAVMGDDVVSVEEERGWFCRLSAPGYMDCTEWSGPYATEEEADEALDEMYGTEEDEDETNE